MIYLSIFRKNNLSRPDEKRRGWVRSTLLSHETTDAHMSELCEWLKRWRFRHLRHVWHDMRQRTEAFEKGIGSNVQFERINLKLQTSKKMFWRFSWLRFTQTTQAFTRTTGGFMKTSIMVWICYDIFWKLHTCVEAKILPEGPPRLNDRGECCAPFSLKNVFRHPRHSPKRPGDSLENLQFWVSKFTQKPKKSHSNFYGKPIQMYFSGCSNTEEFANGTNFLRLFAFRLQMLGIFLKITLLRWS